MAVGQLNTGNHLKGISSVFQGPQEQILGRVQALPLSLTAASQEAEFKKFVLNFGRQLLGVGIVKVRPGNHAGATPRGHVVGRLEHFQATVTGAGGRLCEVTWCLNLIQPPIVRE